MTTTLQKPTFTPLRLGEIEPKGWLINQLQIQASGLSGHLDEFWPDVRDSKWIGGDAEGWERVPYWLDGFIPLAWLLRDGAMMERATRYVDHILAHQSADGWLCPDSTGDRATYDMWALFLLLKTLVVYYDATGDERIPSAVARALSALDAHIAEHPLFDWAHTRWFEALVSIWWLYERTGEQWLLDLAGKLRAQGFDWAGHFAGPSLCKGPIARGNWSQPDHVVNNAMMLKSGPLMWRMTGLAEDRAAAEHMVRLLDEFHGMVTGVFSGDECLAGTSPVQGTELCAVVEYMYSLEHLIALTGQAHWGDRLESIAFNALPAAFSPDMWTHQYDQQVNQVECTQQERPVFLSNGGESNLFGLEPNYGCCTANLSQGWPKFAASTFMRTDDGLAAVAYAPCCVHTTVEGTLVEVALDTEYPFRDTLSFVVTTGTEAEFALWLRIPAWALHAELSIGGCSQPVKPGTFHRIHRAWRGTTQVTLRLPAEARLVARPNDLYAVTRGPLVFSLAIGEEWVRTHEDVVGRDYPHCDYEVRPTTAWNYRLCLGAVEAEAIRFEERPVGDCPFSPAGAPLIGRARGRRVDWPMTNGAAAPKPGMGWVAPESEDLTLIPYGCTNLRMTEMPLV